LLDFLDDGPDLAYEALLHTVAKLGVTEIKGIKTFSTLRPLPSETLAEYKDSISLWKTVDVAVSWQDTAPMHIYKFGKSKRA